MMDADSRPLLAFDTSTPTARVALISPAGECLVLREKTAARHSANLLALCDEILRGASVRVDELRAIACGAGPGSFTGLRVGLAVAKGLALPSALPLVLLSSLDTLACDLAAVSPAAQLLLPCIDAGKGQVYARMYGVIPGAPPRALGEVDWVLDPGALCTLAAEGAAGTSLLAGGTGVDRYLDVFRAALGENGVAVAVPGPSAAAIGGLAWDRIRRGDFDDLETAVPRYGRPPDITRPRKPLLVT
ncbi:MAG TPA: tRNA (adenosine(37)-N6)-threonylcarbamoyltransferase complex dimerization subunit type 1 TsaB [Polyangia bacterium]